MSNWKGPPHENIPRCGAKTRAGGFCGHYAMPNGRVADITVVNRLAQRIPALNMACTPGQLWRKENHSIFLCKKLMTC